MGVSDFSALTSVNFPKRTSDSQWPRLNNPRQQLDTYTSNSPQCNLCLPSCCHISKGLLKGHYIAQMVSSYRDIYLYVSVSQSPESDPSISTIKMVPECLVLN